MLRFRYLMPPNIHVYLPEGSKKQWSTNLEKLLIVIQIHQQMFLNERNNEWMCEIGVAVFAEGLRFDVISKWVNSGRSRATSSLASLLLFLTTYNYDRNRWKKSHLATAVWEKLNIGVTISPKTFKFAILIILINQEMIRTS